MTFSNHATEDQSEFCSLKQKFYCLIQVRVRKKRDKWTQNDRWIEQLANFNWLKRHKEKKKTENESGRRRTKRINQEEERKERIKKNENIAARTRMHQGEEECIKQNKNNESRRRRRVNLLLLFDSFSILVKFFCEFQFLSGCRRKCEFIVATFGGFGFNSAVQTKKWCSWKSLFEWLRRTFFDNGTSDFGSGRDWNR